MNTNPKLQRNLIVEAVFEIRFNPKDSEEYALMLGLLYEKLKKKYSVFEDLNLPEFPAEFQDMSFMPKHRIYSSDRKKLYSLGKGVLSINTLEYSSFEAFLNEINEILIQHKTCSKLSKISRIGLRYINKENNDLDVTKLFLLSNSLPTHLKEKEISFNIVSTLKFDKNLMNLVFFKNPTINEYILDLDFNNNEKSDYDVEKINAWIKEAHAQIHESFKSCLTPEFYNKLLNG